MIDNFEDLVERCNAMRRRRMIRISLIIASVSISLVAIASVLYLYQNNLSKPPVPSEPAQKSSPRAIPEQNLTDNLPLSVPMKLSSPISANYTLPPKDNAKVRAYVIQLTSNRTFADANASRKKVPKQYHTSLAIYHVNGYYTLRYIDIYTRESLPQMIAYFQSLGFNQPTAYKYDPNRIPITSETTLKSTATVPTQEISTPQPVTSIVPAREQTRLFSVQTTPKNTTADLIQAFNTAPNYDTALRLANDFYAQNDFDNAALWAKKANQLNREAEEAWLLYAKSYYAQGKKSEAISVLELYLNYKDSRVASKLLRSWKQNSTGE